MLSLSVGTLPAVKSGMSPDTNHFASQLARITGAETAASDAAAAGTAVSGTAVGSFAQTLAQVPGAQPAVEPIAATTDIPTLPADASPSQIIEAVLNGTKPQPAAPISGTAELGQIAPQGMPEAVDADELAATAPAARPHPAEKRDEPVDTADDAVPIAAPIIDPMLPVPTHPEAMAPENGTARTAISASQPHAGAALESQTAAIAVTAEATDPVATAEAVQSGPVPLPVQRAVQSASQTARPAQALGALLDLADPVAESAPPTPVLETIAPKPVDAVPPSWAAALNAVGSAGAGNTAQGLTAPVTTGSAPGAQLETLAFDSSFVGNIETQIARVAGGGQMVRMQMSPEHLGRIDIEMLAGPIRDQVRIVTEHDAVRDTLVQSQIRLEQDLRNNGNRNTDVTVELRQQSAGTSTGMGGGSAQQRGQSGSDAGLTRDGNQRQAATDMTEESKTVLRRLSDNVRYA
ncbi:flagellar hook-length control protein FliK [Blastomonas aquatica]